MSLRARWVFVGVVLLVLLGVVALYMFDTNLTMSTGDDRGFKTWVVQPGETLTLSEDEVRPNDRYRCAGEESGIEFTPVRGTESYSEVGGLSVRNAEGTVTAYCQTSPPEYP